MMYFKTMMDYQRSVAHIDKEIIRAYRQRNYSKRKTLSIESRIAKYIYKISTKQVHHFRILFITNKRNINEITHI